MFTAIDILKSEIYQNSLTSGCNSGQEHTTADETRGQLSNKYLCRLVICCNSRRAVRVRKTKADRRRELKN